MLERIIDVGYDLRDCRISYTARARGLWGANVPDALGSDWGVVLWYCTRRWRFGL